MTPHTTPARLIPEKHVRPCLPTVFYLTSAPMTKA